MQAFVRPHLILYLKKTNKTLKEKKGRTHKRRFLMDYCHPVDYIDYRRFTVPLKDQFLGSSVCPRCVFISRQLTSPLANHLINQTGSII